MKKVLDVVALGGAMLGSMIIAFNLGHNVIGYFFFLASSIASLLLIQKSDVSKSIYLQCLWFIGMNIIGIIRY